MSRTKLPVLDRLTRRIFVDENNCWNFTGYRNPYGYGNIRIDGKTKLAHRAMWEEVFGEIPAGMYACHKCDNPACINPDHLFLGTNLDNVRDMKNKGRERHVCACGEKCVTSKLTLEDVEKIRSLGENGLSQRKIAVLFGVDRSTVGDIQKYKSWKHENSLYETKTKRGAYVDH
jgi:hypothetical protein